MEESSKDLEKNDEENDEDNLGRDQYFMMDRDDNLSDLESNGDEDSKNTIPNVGNYLNNNNNEIREIVENPKLSSDISIIDNKIEDNINMKNNSMSQNKSMSNINNISMNTIINNNNLNASNINKNYIEDENSFSKEDNIDITQKNDINKNEMIYPNSRNDENPIEILSDEEEDEKDVEIIPGEQFKKHFQEDRYGPQRKIEIMNPEEYQNIMKQNNFKNMMKKKKVNENKIFDNFFQEKDIKINKNEIIPKKNNNIIFHKNKNRNFNHPNTKEFIPMVQNDFKTNTYFEKLLINRVEHQILTDIYNTYEDKSKFDTTNYHISKLKTLMTYNGVDEAIKYLNDIEPLELRTKIAIESTYFFKEVIREEVENAKAHQGKLILIKQPEFIYKKSIMNFCGKINYHRGNSINRMRKSNIRCDNYNYNYNMNNQQRNVFNNNYRINNDNNGEYNINSFHNNPQMFQGRAIPYNH